MSFIDKIIEYFRLMIIDWTEYHFATVFERINEQVSNVSSTIEQSPLEWNAGLWSMSNDIAQTIIMPIAGIVLSGVVCFEFISLMNDKNNLHSTSDISASFVRFFVKTMITVLVILKSPQIILSFFDLATYIVNRAASYFSGSTDITPALSAAEIAMQLQDESFIAVISAFFSILVVKVSLMLVSLLVQIVMVGRMIEIYIYSSLAPITMATLSSKETNSIGINFLKNIAALAMQSFLILMCVGIYSVLIKEIQYADNIKEMAWQLLLCSIMLAFSLFKTGQMAKSLFTAH